MEYFINKVVYVTLQRKNRSCSEAQSSLDILYSLQLSKKAKTRQGSLKWETALECGGKNVCQFYFLRTSTPVVFQNERLFRSLQIVQTVYAAEKFAGIRLALCAFSLGQSNMGNNWNRLENLPKRPKV